MASRNSIYEVFRACRLCGDGGGYKMPIVNFEDELDMRHKIRECVRIEVHRDDKMPPLICELCVDKVNDYFEFLEMCRATDTKTRIRLGLPQVSQLQTFGNESGDCILGVTEPVFVNDDSNDGEPLARQKNRLVVGAKVKKSAAARSSGSKQSSSPIPVISIARTGLKDAKTGLKGLKVRPAINGAQDAGSSRASRPGRSASTPPTAPPKKGDRRADYPSATRGGRHEVSPLATRAGRSEVSSPNTRGGRRDVTPQASRGGRRDESRDNKKIKTENQRRRSPPPPPPKTTRKKKEPRKPGPLRSIPLKSVPLKTDTPKPGPRKPGPLNRRMSVADDKSLLRETTKPPGKRVRERDDDSSTAKKPKVVVKPGPASRAEKRRAPSPLRPEPKRRAPEPAKKTPDPVKKTPEPTRKPAETHPCTLCKATFVKITAVAQHMKAVHSPNFTSNKLACNACGEWFRSADEAATHHRWHKSAAAYVCRRCTAEFTQYISFSKHFANKQCVPSTEVPDEQCPECGLYFPTKPLMAQHKCRGEEGRPGGNCAKCSRKYATHKTLKKHEESCFNPGPKSKVVTVSPEIQRQLKPIHVRVARCDPLLTHVKQAKHYDVSHVKQPFGLDKSCVYPYISSARSIKSEPNDYDLSRVKNEYDDFDYQDNFNYESYTDSDSELELVENEPNLVRNPFARKKKSVDTLFTLSIKSLFSTKCLGQKKIKRKRLRRLRMKEEIKSELMSKEAKSELIENVNGVVDLNADEDKTVDKDGATDGVVAENNTTEKTTEGSSAKEVSVFEETHLFNRDNINQNVSLVVDDLIADVNNIDDVVPESEKDKKGTSQEPSTEKEVNKETDDEKDSSEITDKGNEKVADDQESKVCDVDIKDSTKLTNNDADPSGIHREGSEMLDENKKTTDEMTAVTDNKGTGKVTDNEETSEVAAVVGETSKENHESDSKTTDEEKVSTETDTVTNSVEVDEKSQDIDEDRSTNAEQIFKKDEQSVKIETEQKSQEQDTSQGNSKMDVDEDDFDINSMFSGDLGATALKAKGQLAHSDEKIEETNEKRDGEVEKVNETQTTKVATPDKLKTKASFKLLELKQAAKDSAEPTEHPGAVAGTGRPNVDENQKIPVVRSKMDTETPVIDVRLGENEANIKNNDLESDKLQKEDIESGDLLKDEPQTGSKDHSQKVKLEKTTKSDKCNSDTELENISDSEMMDDKKLMDELDAQISENTKPEERGREIESTAEKKTQPEEKISLDELLMASAVVTDKTTDEKLRESMDLDTISDDEYNFDA